MDTHNMLGGAAIMGLLVAFWSYVKQFLWRILSLLIVRARLEDETAFAVAYLCFKTMRKSPNGERRFSSTVEFIRPKGHHLTVGFETVGPDPILFWRGIAPLLLRMNTGHNSGMTWSYTLTFIRGTFSLDGLIIEALDIMNDAKHNGNSERKRFIVMRRSGSGGRKRRGGNGGALEANTSEVPTSQKTTYYDRRYLKWKTNEMGIDDGGIDPLSGLSFPPEVQDVVDEAQRWKKSELWYKYKQIPWRRGWLFYGPPGTGKTSLARAIAQKLDLPIIVFDLASFSNDEFIKEWGFLLNNSPCMALLEDIDAVFSGRQNRLGDEGGGLTFDCLLNCLSGIETAGGVLTVITTNRVDELDEALGRPGTGDMSTRPGRVDRAVKLGVLDEDCRRRLAERILSDCPELIDAIVAEGDGDTGAQFQERCGRLALDRYWQRPMNGHRQLEVVNEISC